MGVFGRAALLILLTCASVALGYYGVGGGHPRRPVAAPIAEPLLATGGDAIDGAAEHDGVVAESAVSAEIAKNTRALAKKQRTWFRTQLPAHRVVSAETLTDERALFGDDPL